MCSRVVLHLFIGVPEGVLKSFSAVEILSGVRLVFQGLRAYRCLIQVNTTLGILVKEKLSGFHNLNGCIWNESIKTYIQVTQE